MPVNLVQYRGTVGVFNNRKFTKKLQYKDISKLKFIHTCFIADHLSLHSHSMVSFFMLLIVFFLLKPKVTKGVKFNYNKLFLLRAYIAVHKFDVICFSETYLDSTLASDDENLEITHYNLVRSDHTANT